MVVCLQVPVGRPCEVDEIFDKISYNKGAAIIRMLYDWIGNQSFRIGMSQYLNKYAYKVLYVTGLLTRFLHAESIITLELFFKKRLH
jgi:puromycin-sensitive aminopeptidase